MTPPYPWESQLNKVKSTPPDDAPMVKTSGQMVFEKVFEKYKQTLNTYLYLKTIYINTF